MASDRKRISVLYFGPAADRAGCSSEEIELEGSAGLPDLMREICALHPGIEPQKKILRFAVNQEYVEGDTALRDGDEVALIPPVAGGMEEPLVELTDSAIDLDHLLSFVKDESAGAIHTFLGTVRAEGDLDNPLEALEYSAYPDMAIRELQKISHLAIERYELTRVAVVHRLGTMKPGETSVAIVLSAPHRKDGFEACRFIIDTLKEDVPIWKKEIWRRGESSWVDPSGKE